MKMSDSTDPIRGLTQKAAERVDSARGIGTDQKTHTSNAASGGEGTDAMTDDKSEDVLDVFRSRLSEKMGWSEKSWIPYEGPQGGEGWKNPDTGDVVYQKDPPGDVIDPDDMADDDLETLAVEGGIDASPDEIREALQEELGERGAEDGGSPQYGNLSDSASQALADASDEEVANAFEALIGPAPETIDNEAREELASSAASESEILREIGSDVEAVIDPDDLNTAMDAVTDEVRGNLDEIDYDTISETLSRDDSPVDADSDLVDAVAEEFGVGRGSDDTEVDAQVERFESPEGYPEAGNQLWGNDFGPDELQESLDGAYGYAEHENVIGGIIGSDAMDQYNEDLMERVQEQGIDVNSPMDLFNASGFEEDIINNVAGEVAQEYADAYIPDDPEQATDSEQSTTNPDDSTGPSYSEDEINDTLEDYMPGQDPMMINELSFQLSRSDGMDMNDVEDAVDIAGPGGPDNDLLVDQVAAALDVPRDGLDQNMDDPVEKSKQFIESRRSGSDGSPASDNDLRSAFREKLDTKEE